ncbi:MAG TPA: tetratricopeptide repeat protein [Beijerinckiaceae bacterium]|nr:tetratricopeptide repeat protein [Beijerinckiaceae bacterium]
MGNSELKREHDALFAEVLKNPSNVDVSFRYAEVATRLGDYEAAIGALERIIFYNPNLPRVRLELGVLYFRLGSYEMSKSYFESAIAPPDTPIEVRNRVAGFLAEIDRRVQTTHLAFFGQVGLRFQTNANAGPNTPFVRALGFDATLSNQNTRKRDWNWYGSASLRYVYDFENQRGDVFEALVSTYYSRQFDVVRLNTGLVEVNLGPRLALAPDLLQGWSVKPYVVGSAVSLADNNYLNTAGYGVTFAMPLIVVLLEPGYEVRRRAFKNSDEITTAKEQRGWIHTSYLNASGALLPGLRFQARYAHNRVNAFMDYNAYTSNAVDVSFPFEFAGLFESAGKWTIAPFGGFTKSLYDRPNPLVDPNYRRKDKEFRYGVQIDMPIWKNAGFGAVVQYQNMSSSIRNYNTRNFSVSFGPTVRF